MKKRPLSILRSMVIGGLMVTALAKVLIKLTASPVPDPASGRIEPALFAPAISTDWDYVTTWQTMLLIVLTSTVLICFVTWPVAAWLERRMDAAGPGKSALPVPTVRQFRARRSFGRQGS